MASETWSQILSITDEMGSRTWTGTKRTRMAFTDGLGGKEEVAGSEGDMGRQAVGDHFDEESRMVLPAMRFEIYMSVYVSRAHYHAICTAACRVCPIATMTPLLLFTYTTPTPRGSLLSAVNPDVPSFVSDPSISSPAIALERRVGG